MMRAGNHAVQQPRESRSEVENQYTRGVPWEGNPRALESIHEVMELRYEGKIFGTACAPETPIGTCMASSERDCAANYHFGRLARERLRT